MEKDTPTQALANQEVAAEEEDDCTTDNKWVNFVCPDGRKFSELSNEEKKRMRKKLRKKEKAQESKQLEEEYNKMFEGKDAYEVEVAWCVNQLKLGLTRPGVTKEQAKETMDVIEKLEDKDMLKVKKRHLMKVVFGDYRELMKTIR